MHLPILPPTHTHTAHMQTCIQTNTIPYKETFGIRCPHFADDKVKWQHGMCTSMHVSLQGYSFIIKSYCSALTEVRGGEAMTAAGAWSLTQTVTHCCTVPPLISAPCSSHGTQPGLGPLSALSMKEKSISILYVFSFTLNVLVAGATAAYCSEDSRQGMVCRLP